MNQENRSSSLYVTFIVIGIILTLIAIGIGAWIWLGIKEQRVKDLHYTNSVITRYYELGFNQWRNTLLTLGDRLIEVEGNNRDSVRLEIVNSAIKNYDELLAFGLASPDGRVMTFSNSSLNDSLPNLMLSNNSRRSFLKAKETKNMSIGEVYYFDNVNDWILPLRVPIRDANDSLIAVNTTALEYKKLITELNGFGFHPRYHIHLVNMDFNSTQFYYPLEDERYENVLKKEGDIYSETNENEIGGIIYFEGINVIDNHKSLIVHSELKGLNHALYISVDSAILMDDMIPKASIILAMYVVLILLLFWMYRFSRTKELEYIEVLIKSEANLKSIFESTDNIIGLFDTDKNIIEFNTAFYNSVKFTEGIELKKGMSLDQIAKRPEMVELFRNLQNRALNGEKFKETVTYPNPEGGEVNFLLSYNPIYQNNSITGLSLFVEDITELKNYQKKLESQADNLEHMVQERTKELENKNKELNFTLKELKSAQQKLIQAEKMASLGILSAGIGHEINNPLNFIKNGASGLVKVLEGQEKVNLEELKPFFDIINNGVERANAIVKSLSHFSRQVKSMDEECDLNEIINNCLTILNNKLKNKIEIEKDLDEYCPSIKGNEGKLHQVILNLLTNAEQAITKNGKIKISTLINDHGKLQLKIEDNGEGISPENIDRIADPFFTTKEPGKGTGLGLFITYTIIEEHNGRVTVNSEVNKGTTFTIEFDLGKKIK